MHACGCHVSTGAGRPSCGGRRTTCAARPVPPRPPSLHLSPDPTAFEVRHTHSRQGREFVPGSNRHGPVVFFHSLLPSTTAGRHCLRFGLARPWRACTCDALAPLPLAARAVNPCRSRPCLPSSFFSSPTRLTIPSSGLAYGQPLKSNVRLHKPYASSTRCVTSCLSVRSVRCGSCRCAKTIHARCFRQRTGYSHRGTTGRHAGVCPSAPHASES